ncbi:MAG: hypothetical protein HY819_03800 [Acidobacteria bacterium]|nr:hypothetical protein [Acidobacteriota bacterium]
MSYVQFHQFSSAAINAINNLKYAPDASCAYEVMSGGLFWTDEITDDILLEDDNYTFRYIFAYRASLILEKENKDLRPIWEQMAIQFPNWPGLREERCSPKLKNLLLARKGASMKELKDLLRNCGSK